MVSKLVRKSDKLGSVAVGTVLDLMSWVEKLDCVRDVEGNRLVHFQQAAVFYLTPTDHK